MEFEKIREIICQVLNVDEDAVTMKTSFIDDLGADSMDLFQIIMGIEEELDLEIDTKKAQNVTTVGEAVELVKSIIG